MSSFGIFDTPEHADESSSDWVRENKLETVLPTTSKITSGKVPAQQTRERVQA